jgi:death-on-curing protein
VTKPKWITRQQVEFIHEAVIEIGGGAHGLRDASLLESALARPQNQHAYGETDTFQLAASYAEGISRNHAFIDGNKRTAFYVAADFLEQNGHQLQAAAGVEHAEMMELLGQGKLTREQAASHLRKYSQIVK